MHFNPNLSSFVWQLVDVGWIVIIILRNIKLNMLRLLVGTDHVDSTIMLGFVWRVVS